MSEIRSLKSGSKRVKPQKAQKTQRKVKDQTEIFRLYPSQTSLPE